MEGAIRSQEVNPAKLAMLFRKQFELCQCKRGDTIAIVSDLGTRREYIQAAFAAADDLGVDIYEMCVNAIPGWTKVGVPTIGKCKGTLEALLACDMVLIFHVPLFSKWLRQVQQKGVRVQMIIDAPDDLEQLQSPPGLKEAVLHAHRLYENTRTVRVTSKVGTDLTYSRGEYPVMSQYGMADEPGRFDHWGVGLLHTFPDEGSARGRVVFQPGDIVILPYCRYVADEVRLEISEGHITRIEGGLDAALMRDWLEDGKDHPDDRDPFAVSHLGWGLNPQCRWDAHRPLRRCAGAQPRGGAQLSGQLPVLHRPQFAGRRQARYARPLRRADAWLHDRAGRQGGGGARAHRRPEDDRAARAALKRRVPSCVSRANFRCRSRTCCSTSACWMRACWRSASRGASRWRRMDEARYRAGVAVAMAGISVRFNLIVELTHQEPPRRIVCVTRGEEGGRASMLSADSEIKLKALDGQSTRVQYVSEVQLTGRLGRFALGVMQKKAQAMGRGVRRQPASSELAAAGWVACGAACLGCRLTGSLREALALLDEDPEAKPLSGGATLVAMMNARVLEPAALISLSAIAELQGISQLDGGSSHWRLHASS